MGPARTRIGRVHGEEPGSSMVSSTTCALLSVLAAMSSPVAGCWKIAFRANVAFLGRRMDHQNHRRHRLGFSGINITAHRAPTLAAHQARLVRPAYMATLANRILIDDVCIILFPVK